MSSFGTFATLEELEALRALTREQNAAARAGDLQRLQRATAARGQLLEALSGRHVQREEVEQVAATDLETKSLVEAWMCSVGAALSRIAQGQRALHAYTVAFDGSRGFVNQLQ